MRPRRVPRALRRHRALRHGIAGIAIAALAIGAAALPGDGDEAASDAPSARAVEPSVPALQDFPFYPYDGRWTFVRIRTSGYRGWGRRGWGGGWSHDYPDAEHNFSIIMSEFTLVDATLEEYGGNVLTFDDPRLHHFPIAYVSEPGDWRTNEQEAAALRRYLLQGGFVIFDDFFAREMSNVHYQMRFAFPELDFLRLDGSEEIWESFFSLEPREIYLRGPRKEGVPEFWGLYVDNDKSKRMLAVAGAGADIGDLWEWSHRGYYPVDPTNEAYRIGINYVVYALTH